MNAIQEIANKILQPYSLNRNDIDTLKELSLKYPYSQVFSILYLKGLGDVGSVHFDDELNKHSYRIGDRERLYYLINDATNLKDEDEVSTLHTEVEKTGPLSSDIIEKKIQIGETSNIQEIKTTSPLDDTILQHAFTANYQLESLTDEEEKRLQEIKSKEGLQDHQLDSIAHQKVIEIDTKQSFTSWLQSNKNYEVKINEDKIAIDSLVHDFDEFDPSKNLFGDANRPKQEFFSPSKRAKESLNEELLPVSETLAKIYASQGNFPKAISAYEQLILNNPEKKIFFANRIKELTQKLTNK